MDLWDEVSEGSKLPSLLAGGPPGSITPLERVVRRTLRPLAEYKLFLRSIQERSRGLLLKLFDPQTQTWRMEPEILRVKKSEVTL